MTLLPFPLEDPYRIDQVRTAPLLMGGLFALQLAACLVMTWSGEQATRRAAWWSAAGCLLLAVAVFFGLGSWGNSDTTKFSYSIVQDIARADMEPFWHLAAPVIAVLPYRMAAVHGLVVAGFAAVPVLLALCWQARGWGGWWALLLCCSPLLRPYLQSGVTRQALASLLLLPLFLRTTGLLRPGSRPVLLGVTAAALVHKAFVMLLLIHGAPLLVSARLLRGVRRKHLIAAAAILLSLSALMGTLVLRTLGNYVEDVGYVNLHALAPAVERLLLAMGLGVLLSCWSRRLGWRELWSCALSRQLALFLLLYVATQAAIEHHWFPQLFIRAADPLGFCLLLLFLGWLNRHRTLWAALPALLVTLDYWVMQRLVPAPALNCGLNDDFLCVPDRWPWQVRYWANP